MTHKDGLRELEEAEIDEYVAEIEAEKAAAEAAKKGAPKENWFSTSLDRASCSTACLVIHFF